MIPASIILTLLLVAPLPGEELYLKARAAEENAKYGDAYATYKACSEAGGPLEPYALIRAAYCMGLGGAENDALQAYKAAVEKHPEGPWVRLAEVELASLLAKMGRVEEASRLYTQALDVSMRPSWLRRYEWQAADVLLRDPSAQANAYGYFRKSLDTAKYGADRLDAARRLILSPDLHDRVLALAGMLRSSAFKEANTAVESINSHFADRAASSADLRLLQMSLAAFGSDPASAHAAVNSTLRDNPNLAYAPLALHLVVRGYIAKKQFESARAVCQTMTETCPKSPETAESLWRLGSALADAGQKDAAIAIWDLLIATCPEHTRAGDAILAAGRIREKEGQHDRALETYRLAVSLPTANRRTAAALYRSGDLAERLGRRDEALQDYLLGARQPIGDFFVHRSADRVIGIDASQIRAGRSLSVAGPKSYVRPIPVVESIELPPGLEHDPRMQRMRFFGFNGLPEGEWEALDLAQKLEEGRIGAILLAMAESGLAHTAMEVADTLSWGVVNGAPTSEKLRVLYPRAYWDIAVDEARAAGVDPYLLLAMARQESTFRARIESHAGASGVMQIMPSTAKWMARTTSAISDEVAAKLDDPAASIRMGAQYLSMMLERYDGNVVLALGAYNAGPGNMNKWTKSMQTGDLDVFIENIPFEETKNYVQRVLGNYAAYHSLYPGDGGS